MADESFEKAPLVEIVAELRWIPADLALPAQQEGTKGITIATSQPPSLEKLFTTFNGEVYQNDFKQVERLVPSNFPIMLHQPIFRFRKDQKDPALFQLGFGLFSANGLQPYRSWRDFRPVVEIGVKALLKARVPEDAERQFILHSLRYIDAFGPELLNQQSIPKFISETLGISVGLPSSLGTLIDNPDGVKSRLKLSIPIKASTKTMALTIGEGTLPSAPTTPTVIMQMTITEASVEADASKIMEAFDTSRAIIHDSFVKMTEKIHALMQPRQAG